MRDYAKVSPLFWTRGSGKRLRGNADAQVLALYFVTCPAANMIGVYYVPLVSVAHETGLGMDRTLEALAALGAADFAHYDHDHELVWVPNMASYQIGDELKAGDKRRFAVVAEIDKLGGHRFAAAFLERYGVAYGLRSNGSFSSIAPSPSQGVCETGDQPAEGQTALTGRAGEEQEQEKEKSNLTPHARQAMPEPVALLGLNVPLEADALKVWDTVAMTTGRLDKANAPSVWLAFVGHNTGKVFPSRAALLGAWQRWLTNEAKFEGRDRARDAERSANAATRPARQGARMKQPAGSAGGWSKPVPRGDGGDLGSFSPEEVQP
jgi:hypothetical protein